MDVLDASRASDLFVGRRAILDADLAVHAYELVHRHEASASRAEIAERLASVVRAGALTRLSSGRPVWLPTTAEVLADGALGDADPAGLVLEVLPEDLEQPEGRVVLAELRRAGARVAVREHAAEPLAGPLPEFVDVLRLDGETVRPVDVAGRLAGLRAAGVRLFADDVRTHKRRRWLAEGGIDLFAGVFLTEPDVPEIELPANRLATLRLIAELDRPDVEVDEVEQLVAQDVAMSYQILKYVNSAYIGLRQKVSSIRQAVVLLGPPTVRQIAAVALLASDDKPAELIRTALVRAKLCEGLARALKEPPSSYYTAGLFSSLEAITDAPLAVAVEELPLTDDVRDAILHRTGPIGRAIRAALAHERCDWDDPALGFFDDDALGEAYFTAITWVDEVLRAMAEPA